MSEPSTNQIIFRGLSSNIRSFLVSYWDHKKGINYIPYNYLTLHRYPAVKELSSGLLFLWEYEQWWFFVSGNTGLAPLIGSKVIRAQMVDGSIWSARGPRIQCPTPNQTRTASGPRRTERLMEWKGTFSHDRLESDPSFQIRSQNSGDTSSSQVITYDSLLYCPTPLSFTLTISDNHWMIIYNMWLKVFLYRGI